MLAESERNVIELVPRETLKPMPVTLQFEEVFKNPKNASDRRILVSGIFISYSGVTGTSRRGPFDVIGDIPENTKNVLEGVVVSLQEEVLHDVEEVLPRVDSVLADLALKNVHVVFDRSAKLGATTVLTGGRVFSVITEKNRRTFVDSKEDVHKVIFIAS